MNIAILGYGVVGKGVEKMAIENNINVASILMRPTDKLVKTNMTADLDKILHDKTLDAIIECIGGDEPAFTYVKNALNRKIAVISSNKKMIANHFDELIKISNDNDTPFLFSSACGGAIPFLPTLSNISQSDILKGFKGIINGTSNYILNKMYFEKVDFDVALKQAQKLGYAEQDPSDDIDGVDTANKAVLAMGVGFNALVKPEDIFIRGIRHYNLDDMNFIKKRGYRACLMAKGYKKDNGYALTVMPSFVNDKSAFYNINTNFNCLYIEAENLGSLSLIGQGAGSLPTASNILRDIQLLTNPYKVCFKERIKPDDINNVGTFYLRTTHAVDMMYVKEDLGNNSYITKKISIDNLRKILKNNDFVGEIIDD